MPAFPELRHFKQGRRFKQWTGDDSKALMKVCNHHLALTITHYCVGVSTCYKRSHSTSNGGSYPGSTGF
jgi:hypothetical protein